MSPVKEKAANRPPSTLMLVSNTEISLLGATSRELLTHSRALLYCGELPNPISNIVSRESTMVAPIPNQSSPFLRKGFRSS